MREKKLPLRGAMPIVAAALGGKFGVDIIVEGLKMETDGKRIWIPAFDPKSQRLREVAYGVIAHECGHVRHTDWAVLKRVGQPLRRTLLNIIEDIRIEAALAVDYPGTRRSITLAMEHLIDQGRMPPAETTDHPARILTTFMLQRLRLDVLGQVVFASNATASEAVASSVFSRSTVDRLAVLMNEVRRLKSTAEALNLADRILNMLGGDEERKDPEMRDSEPDRDADGGAESGAGGTDPSDERSSDDDDDADVSKPEPGKGEGGQDNAEAPNSKGETSKGGSDKESGAEHAKSGDAITRALSATSDEVGDDDPMKAAAAEVSAAARREVESRVAAMASPIHMKGDLLTGKAVVERARAASGKIRSELLRLTQASRRAVEYPTRRGRSIDGRKLSRVILHDTRVFVRREETAAPNTAIHILVDRSGSMAMKAVERRNRLDVAIESAVALALALETIPGVNTAITAFPASRTDGDHDPRRATGVCPLLGHGEKVRRTAANFAVTAAGGTPMAEAMWYAAAQLLNMTREERKILMVITDGRPNNIAHVKDMVRRCDESGIEIVGIGIREAGVAALYPTALVIQDVADLKRALFDVMRDKLIGAAA